MSLGDDVRGGQPSQGRRRGKNFSVRITAAERKRLEALHEKDNGPRGLGAWLVWRALEGDSPALPKQWALPELTGTASAPGTAPAAAGTAAAANGALPARSLSDESPALPPPAERVVLDLCGGSGSWSQPYRDAGYDVRLVTLPHDDVRLYVPPPIPVWGVLAAPPCTEFSLAKNGQPRDFVKGMECVNACMRIVLQCRARWWALENPAALLGEWLGIPRDVFNPCDFGDPWTKRTALWGDFAVPKRGPFVEPRSGMVGANAAERAVTPPGFARAFFEANP